MQTNDKKIMSEKISVVALAIKQNQRLSEKCYLLEREALKPFKNPGQINVSKIYKQFMHHRDESNYQLRLYFTAI